jgi:hypothetical protein
MSKTDFLVPAKSQNDFESGLDEVFQSLQLAAQKPACRSSSFGGPAAFHRGGTGGTDYSEKMTASLIYPLVNCYIAMERSTIFNGKIHYFYGHVQ